MLPENTLESEIHRRSSESANIVWTHHARERMEERGITAHDAIRVLREGSIKGNPKKGKQKGEWVCKIAKHIVGVRDAGVITAVVAGKKLIIITVEWEDV